MASTNYGIDLQRETAVPDTYATVGSATSIDLPSWITDEIESTAHDGGGYKSFKTSLLKGMDAFSATYICDATLITLIKTDMLAKTVSKFQITGAGDFATLKFSAFFKSFQILGADSTSPDVIKVQLELQPTGTLTAA